MDHGHRYLKPIRLKYASEKLERNESITSLAVSNKYVDTQQGLLPMEFFFWGAITDTTRGKAATRSVKEDIKNLISNENTEKPFSYQEIYHHLAEKGMSISPPDSDQVTKGHEDPSLSPEESLERRNQFILFCPQPDR